MGNLGVPEILIIAVVAIVLFGAGRLADIGKGLGQGIKNFKQGVKEANEIDTTKADDKKSEDVAKPKTDAEKKQAS